MKANRYVFGWILAGLVTLASFAVGQTGTSAQQTQAKKSDWQLGQFNEFLERHPNISADLKKNPNLVNDQSYVSQHAELKEFLTKHPDLRDRLKQNPSLFMREEAGVKEDTENAKTAKWQVGVFHSFLEQHPNIAQDLRKNPNLVNDQNYVSQHGELKQFLAKHGDLAERFTDNPTAFMQQEAQLDKRH